MVSALMRASRLRAPGVYEVCGMQSIAITNSQQCEWWMEAHVLASKVASMQRMLVGATNSRPHMYLWLDLSFLPFRQPTCLSVPSRLQCPLQAARVYPRGGSPASP
jgi:hypothetical protein